jgi:hypothetical protein
VTWIPTDWSRLLTCPTELIKVGAALYLRTPCPCPHDDVPPRRWHGGPRAHVPCRSDSSLLHHILIPPRSTWCGPSSAQMASEGSIGVSPRQRCGIWVTDRTSARGSRNCFTGLSLFPWRCPWPSLTAVDHACRYEAVCRYFKSQKPAPPPSSGVGQRRHHHESLIEEAEEELGSLGWPELMTAGGLAGVTAWVVSGLDACRILSPCRPAQGSCRIAAVD